jgi:hypothetical protein
LFSTDSGSGSTSTSPARIPAFKCHAFNASREEEPTALRFSFPSSLQIETPAFAVGGLAVDEHESGVGLAILPNNRYELPAAPYWAILYEVNLLMAISTVHVLRAPSVCEAAVARDFMKMISKMISGAVTYRK